MFIVSEYRLDYKKGDNIFSYEQWYRSSLPSLRGNA